MILKLSTSKKRYPAFISIGFEPNKGGNKNNGIKSKQAEKVDLHDPSI